MRSRNNRAAAVVSRSAASKSNGHFRSRRQAVRAGGGNTHADKQNNVMCGALCINSTLQFSIDKKHGSLSNRQCTMCKIANFEGQMGGHNLNKIDGFLVTRDYI